MVINSGRMVIGDAIFERESRNKYRGSQRGGRWILELARAALQVVWGQSVRGALVVFQPINRLHIFNPVRCSAEEKHWRMYGHYSAAHIREKSRDVFTPNSDRLYIQTETDRTSDTGVRKGVKIQCEGSLRFNNTGPQYHLRETFPFAISSFST